MASSLHRSFLIGAAAGIVLAVCGCALPTDGLTDDPARAPGGTEDLTYEIVIPEVRIPDGGVRTRSGTVKYHNSARNPEESDVRLDPGTAAGFQTVRRYMYLSGTAAPDDSGLTDRRYHTVMFGLRHEEAGPDDPVRCFAFPVDERDRFAGYLYFDRPGAWTVFSYRYPNEYLYPDLSRGTGIQVPEWSSTLSFTVDAAEAVPPALHHLLPSRNVDAGNLRLRNYAETLTRGIPAGLDQVRALFEFLVHGDEEGRFAYTYYADLSPGYLDREYTDIMIASQFLLLRRGVCNDFAELFAALARSLGYDVRRVTGRIPPGEDRAGAGPQWNTILVDGKWYRLDATWANGSLNPGAPDTRYRRYAEFYPEFDAAEFTDSHERTYSHDLKIEW